MAELKTKPTDISVGAFIASLPDEQKRQDCLVILELMKEVTGAEPKMWGESIIGLGSHHYRYASGTEGDWFMVGFSPRKQNITIYLMYGVEDHPEIMKKLGKYKTGKACLYIKHISDIDLEALKELIILAVEETRRSES